MDPNRTQRGVAPPAPGEMPATVKVEPLRYRLGSRLGHTGQVYEAYNTGYAGRLAVKLFPFAAGLAPTAVGAFTREAARVAELRHPHIVQVLRTGAFVDGIPFVAMERLTGQTLEERLAGRSVAVPVGELMPVVRGIASALSAAHAVGVVHRELRADNVFIADLTGYELGFPKLLDFGVSRLTAAARAAGRIVGPGTLQTLAPEQRQGAVDSADARTDQYLLAALTYRLLTGADSPEGPQSGPGFERLRQKHPEGRTEPVPCPPIIEAVLRKAMSKRPEQRFDSVAAFLRALQEVVPDYPDEPMVASIEALIDAAPETRVADDSDDGALAAAMESQPRRQSPEPPTMRLAVAPRLPEELADSEGGATGGAPRIRAMKPLPFRPAPTAHGTLTQQFFIEGERQEAEANHWERFSSSDLSVVDRAPRWFDQVFETARRRGPMLAGAFIAIVGAVVAVRATGLLSSRGAATPAGGIVADGKGPSLPVQAPGPMRQAASPPARGGEAPFGNAAAPAGLRSPTRAAVPLTPAPSGPLPGETVAPSPPGRVEPAAPPAIGVAQAAPTRGAPPAPAVLGAGRSARISSGVSEPRAAPAPSVKRDRGGPLRGYVWSEGRRRLVRATPAGVPVDSGPPPPLGAPPPPSPAAGAANVSPKPAPLETSPFPPIQPALPSPEPPARLP